MEGQHYIVRNKEIRDWVGELVKEHRLPFKVYIQPIFPEKSPNQLAYLFGVVCKRISTYTGHTPQEVYSSYKELFNLEYSPDKNGVWRLRYKGVSDTNTIELEEFAMMIRADAVIDMGINIELPNEVFVNELDYSTHDRIEQQMERSDRVVPSRIPKLSFRVRNYRK